MCDGAAVQSVVTAYQKETRVTDTTSLILKAVVIVLALIGLIALLGAAGMAAMHFGMMGGMLACHDTAPARR